MNTKTLVDGLKLEEFADQFETDARAFVAKTLKRVVKELNSAIRKVEGKKVAAPVKQKKATKKKASKKSA